MMAEAADEPDARPGMVAVIQTFGSILKWNPHIHAIGEYAESCVRPSTVRPANRKTGEPRSRAVFSGIDLIPCTLTTLDRY
jgi:hypothetical protein